MAQKKKPKPEHISIRKGTLVIKKPKEEKKAEDQKRSQVAAIKVATSNDA